jgi:uncharacterized protein YukE
VSKAVVDPGEVRRFAEELKRFNTELEQRIRVLGARAHDLGQSWRDQEHRKFMEEFEQTLRAVNRFTQVSGQHVPFLLRKAQRIEDYLQQR